MISIESVIDRTLIFFPVFRILIGHIKFIEDKSIATACTTGSIIFYNSEFLEKLTKNQQAFVIAHELAHITLKHLSRRQDRDPEIWNYATDAVANQILVKNGFPLIDGVINCPDAISFSAEEYYDIVKNRPDCDEIMSKYRQKKDTKKIATHEHWNEEQTNDFDKDLPDINEHNITEINKKIIHDDNQKFVAEQEKQQEFQNNIANVGEASSVLDWKSILQRKRKKVVSADYNLYNGYFDDEGIYKYPYELIRKPMVEILIDTSGSVDDNLVKAFLRECKNIFNDFSLKVGCFDTEFYGFQNIKNLADLDNFEIKGRGGTDFSTAINSFSKKSTIKIIFTDGYDTLPTNSKDAIWLVYGNSDIKKPGVEIYHVDPDTLTIKGKSR